MKATSGSKTGYHLTYFGYRSTEMAFF